MALKKFIQTQHAPLTKGFGDAQLAESSDVEVYVDGVQVSVSRVEPTQGLIYLDQTIPPGSKVEVSYSYTPSPTLEFAEFNNFGYGFNQYGDSALGSKFPFNAVFSPTRGARQPLHIGHTYTALQCGYTSTLNDPTTLLFNEPPHAAGLPQLSREIDPSFVFFEGNGLPTGGWEVSGQGPILPEFEENLFVVDDTSTSVNVIDSDPLFYRRDEDLTFPHISNLNFRLKVFSYELDGDFTGVATGFSGESSLYFLGFLEKDGFTFAGFLGKDGDETDWRSYHGISATITPRTVTGNVKNDRIITAKKPPLMGGDQIFVAGDVYEVDSVTLNNTGGYDILTTPEMSDTGQIQMFPEMEFTQLSSYRIFKNENGLTKAFSRGTVAPFATIYDENLPYEEEIFELLETNEFFFGSVSRKAKSRTGWDFVRYSVLPSLPEERANTVHVELELTQLPEKHPTQPWTLLDDQGYATILENDYLLLEQAGRPDEGSFTYGRIEPLLTSQTRVEMETRLRVDAFAKGMPSHITIADEQRELTLGLFAGDIPDPSSTLYETLYDAATYKITSGFGLSPSVTSLLTSGLIPPDGVTTSITTVSPNVPDLTTFKVTSGQAPNPTASSILTKGTITQGTVDPAVDVDYRMSYPGVQSFGAENWTENLGTVESTFIDHFHRMEKPSGSVASVTKELDFPSSGVVRNYLFSARIRLNDWELNTDGRVAVRLGVDDGLSQIYLSFMEDSGTKKVVMVDESGQLVTDNLGDPLGFGYDWDDGEFHTYKAVRSTDTITIFVDGVFKASLQHSQLPVTARSTNSSESSLILDNEQISLDVDYWFLHFTEYSTRRVGLYRGGGDQHNPVAYEFVEAEWLGTFLDIRISRDPAGKTDVYLNGSSTPAFSKQYSELPFRDDRPEINTRLGYVQFGNADPNSHSESVWDHVNYSIYNARENFQTLPHSLFNVAHPVTSPEPVYDETPEEMLLLTNTKDQIYLSAKGLKAKRILEVRSEDKSTSHAFTFDESANEITLTTPLPDRRTPLWVRFLSKKPYGANYLAEQVPVNQLNEGTPPFEKSMEVEIETVDIFVSQYNADNASVFGGSVDMTLTDGRVRVAYSVNDSMLLESLDLKSTELRGEKGLLHPACDDLGWTEITLEGYEDSYVIPKQAPDGFGQYEKEFWLDSMGSLLDGFTIMEPTSDAEVEAMIQDLRKDTYEGATDEALGGTLDIIDGFLLDSMGSSLDNTEDELDDYDVTSLPIDFTTTVN